MSTFNPEIENDKQKTDQIGLTARELFCALIAESWSQMWDEPNELTFDLDQIS